MIRGPVLPQGRERLWALVAQRLAVIETGLELVSETLDCSGDRHGAIEGLCRDASGAPVLVALAVDGDAMLLPRILAAAEFLDRVGVGFAAAVPEGTFCPDARPRLLVVGTEASTDAMRTLLRVGLPELEACRLEPFRLAGSERFAVRWLDARPVRASIADGDCDGVDSPEADDDIVVGAEAPHWRAIVDLCDRLDAGVRIDGGRFHRRITWRGRLLGEVTSADGRLCAKVADGPAAVIFAKGDVHLFGDRLMRRYAELVGLAELSQDVGESAVPRDCEGDVSDRLGRRRESRATGNLDTFRSDAAEPLLSPEEFAALAEPTGKARPPDPSD